MRILVGILLVLVVAGGVAGIATYSYNSGVAQGLAESGKLPAPGTGGGPYPVYPYPGYPYGYGFHGPFGFGFFGFLWPLLFIFLVFALLRGVRGYGWGHHGGVPHRFEEWHRRAHESKGTTGTV